MYVSESKNLYISIEKCIFAYVRPLLCNSTPERCSSENVCVPKSPENAKSLCVHKLFGHYIILIYVLNTIFDPELSFGMSRFSVTIFRKIHDFE